VFLALIGGFNGAIVSAFWFFEQLFFTPKRRIMRYDIRYSGKKPSLEGNWDEPAWRSADVITLDHFVARSSAHHPRVEVKALWTHDGLYVFFRVHDRYIRCVRTDYQACVCADSCVEFFVEPKEKKGYFNFEINCGGTMLLYYIDNPVRDSGKLKIIEQVPLHLGKMVRIYHSMPKIVYPEVKFEATWKIEYFIPFKLFEHYLGPLGKINGQVWRGNFYKCADECSCPHWASWAPLHGKASFHIPQYFAPLQFVGG